MTHTETRSWIALYVDPLSQQWVVRDREGNLWIVPASSHSWHEWQPYEPTGDAESELVPVPRHYQYVLNLPF